MAWGDRPPRPPREKAKWIDLHRRLRYAWASKPIKRGFGEADAKAVLRQFRRGHSVSRKLVLRAVKTLVESAYSRGYDDG